MLTKLEIQNYKSLHRVELDLPPFCTLVGANAAGKTNLADAIEFLSIVAKSGLPAAVTEKGGYENICFRRARRAKAPVRFRMVVTGVALRRWGFLPARGQASLEFDFTFAFRAGTQQIRSKFSVVEERLTIRRKEQETAPWKEIFRLEDHKGTENGPKVRISPAVKGYFPPERFLYDLLRKRARPAGDDLTVFGALHFPLIEPLRVYLSRFRVFQVMPALARRPASASGSREMGKGGENLPAALDALKRDHPEAFAKLLDYLRLAVPTVERLETDYVETHELGLFLREEGMGRRMYASELSDGTLRTIAIFLPLVDPSYTVVVIEEPENCIHPWVIRQFVDAAREYSGKKQIILTTHSPILVSRLTPSELFVADRRAGESEILPATEVEDAKVQDIVRKGIMDLGAYWDSGAMRAVPVQPTLFEGVEK